MAVPENVVTVSEDATCCCGDLFVDCCERAVPSILWVYVYFELFTSPVSTISRYVIQCVYNPDSGKWEGEGSCFTAVIVECIADGVIGAKIYCGETQVGGATSTCSGDICGSGTTSSNVSTCCGGDGSLSYSLVATLTEFDISTIIPGPACCSAGDINTILYFTSTIAGLGSFDMPLLLVAGCTTNPTWAGTILLCNDGGSDVVMRVQLQCSGTDWIIAINVQVAGGSFFPTSTTLGTLSCAPFLASGSVVVGSFCGGTKTVVWSVTE